MEDLLVNRAPQADQSGFDLIEVPVNPLCDTTEVFQPRLDVCQRHQRLRISSWSVHISNTLIPPELQFFEVCFVRELRADQLYSIQRRKFLPINLGRVKEQLGGFGKPKAGSEAARTIPIVDPPAHLLPTLVLSQL